MGTKNEVNLILKNSLANNLESNENLRQAVTRLAKRSGKLARIRKPERRKYNLLFKKPREVFLSIATLSLASTIPATTIGAMLLDSKFSTWGIGVLSVSFLSLIIGVKSAFLSSNAMLTDERGYIVGIKNNKRGRFVRAFSSKKKKKIIEQNTSMLENHALELAAYNLLIEKELKKAESDLGIVNKYLNGRYAVALDRQGKIVQYEKNPSSPEMQTALKLAELLA